MGDDDEDEGDESDEYFDGTVIESSGDGDAFEELGTTSGDELMSTFTTAQLQHQQQPKLLPTTILDAHLTSSRPLHQRSILKINPQHGTPAGGGPPALHPPTTRTNRPLPKLVKATALPGMTSFQNFQNVVGGGSSLLIQPLPIQFQAPSFSLTREFLEGEPPGEGGGEGRKKGGTKRRFLPGSPAPGGLTIAYPHRINKNNNISTSNLNDPGDPNSPFICPLCGKAYVHLRSLKDHMKAHRGLTRCPACGKSFSKVANMRAHFAVQHASKLGEGGLDLLGDIGDIGGGSWKTEAAETDT